MTLLLPAHQGVLQRMQHHTLTVEECVGTKCSTEVVNVHDTAMLDEQARLTSLNPQSTNASDLRLGSVTIKKQVGKPLVVTVRQDDSDPGQQVKSGGALLTDEAKSRVASHNQAASSQALNPDDPQGVQKTAQVAEDLSKNGAAGLREGDNVLDIHRDDLELSPNAVNPISLSSHTNITDANSLEIMRNTNSSSLLSGFNSEQARSETAEQQQQQQQQQQQHQEIDVAEGEAQRFTGIRLGTAMRQLLSQQLQ